MTKVTIIGAGSYSWGPTFLRDIFATPLLSGSTICLEDIDPERLDLTYALGMKMLNDFNFDFKLEKTLDLRAALEGADVIILTITTGGFSTMRHDLEIPAKYGILHTVGDTVGPGGLSRAIRNIPVVADIAKHVDEICPDALFLNYTNPMSTLTRTIDRVRSTPNKTVGLCHEWHGVRKKLAELFKTSPSKITSTIAGINHLPWALDFFIDGNDKWSELLALGEKILTGQITPDEDDSTPFADHFKVKVQLLKVYGALPVAGDRHVSEFFSNFITSQNEWGKDLGVLRTSIEYREGLQEFERALIQSMLSGETDLSPFMKELSGESASEIITALKSQNRFIGVMNLPNSGQINNLPTGAIVETYGIIDNTGARGISVGDMPLGVKAILERHILNQEMTIEAALTGNKDLCIQVLLNDPFCCNLTIHKLEQMLDEFLRSNKEWLPRFFN